MGLGQCLYLTLLDLGLGGGGHLYTSKKRQRYGPPGQYWNP